MSSWCDQTHVRVLFSTHHLFISAFVVLLHPNTCKYTHTCVCPYSFISCGMAADQSSTSLCIVTHVGDVWLITSQYLISYRCWLHTSLPSLPFFCLFTFLLLPDKKDDIAIPPAVVMPTPSKRGRKSKQGMGRLAGVGGVLPPGSDALILAHLAAGGQVRVSCVPSLLHSFVRVLTKLLLISTQHELSAPVPFS